MNMRYSDGAWPAKAGSRRPSTQDVILGVLVFHLLSPPIALGYLDPISGSIVLQILAAGFLAAAATFRRSRSWFAGLIKRLTNSQGS
jgi:hypothetical protein